MKQAHIKCPHCGSGITVRQSDATDMKPEQVEAIWAMADDMFKIMDDYFRKIFHPSLWKAR